MCLPLALKPALLAWLAHTTTRKVSPLILALLAQLANTRMTGQLEVLRKLIASLALLANGRTPLLSALLMCLFLPCALIAKPGFTEPQLVRQTKIMLALNVSKANTTMAITAVTSAQQAHMEMLPGLNLLVSARSALLADGALALDLPPLISAPHAAQVHTTPYLAPLWQPIAYLAVLASILHLLELRHALTVRWALLPPALLLPSALRANLDPRCPRQALINATLVFPDLPLKLNKPLVAIVAVRASTQKQMEVIALIVERVNFLQVHHLLVPLVLWDITTRPLLPPLTLAMSVL